jgi:PAS domain S-box-containing protein
MSIDETPRRAFVSTELSPSQRSLVGALHVPIELLASAPVGMVAVDAAGAILYANAAFCRMLEYSPSELRQRSAGEITHPADRDETERIIRQIALGTIRHHNLVKRYISRAGNVVEADVSLSAFRPNPLGPPAVIAIVQDRTSSARARDVERVRERQLSLAKEAAAIGTWELLLPDGPLSVSGDADGFENVEHFLASVHDDDRDAVRVLFDEAMAGERELDIELRLRRDERAPRWYRVRGALVRGNEGALERMVGIWIDVDDRRALEASLRQSRDLFERVMENSPFIVAIRDERGRFVYANRRFAEELGLDQVDINGRDVRELLPAMFAERILGGDQRVLATNQVVREVERYGEPERAWLVVKFPFETLGGRRLVAGIAIDATDRLRWVADFRRQFERYRYATQLASSAIAEWDIRSNTVWWEGNSLAVLGYRSIPTSMDFEWWRARLHESDRERVLDSLRVAMESRDTFYSVSYRFYRGDGTTAHLQFRGTFVYDAAGEPLRLVGVLNDDTEKVLSRRALSASEARFRRIIELAQEGVWIMDRDGRTTFVNDRLLAMLDRDAADLLGATMDGFATTSSIATARAIVDGAREGRIHRREVQFICRDRVLWTIVSITPIEDLPGAPGGLLAFVTDITDQKIAENLLRDSNEELERRVRERTAQIDETMTQLRSEQERQRQFMADASHDLRTPLTVMHAELQMLAARNDVAAAAGDSIRRLEEEVKRLDHLAGNLLLLATIDAQEGIAQRERVGLEGILFDCIADLSTLARDRGIAIDVAMESAVDVFADRHALVRALDNVLDNAIKYSASGGAVRVRLDVDGERAIVAIEDAGPGIAEADLPHVCDRFYRGRTTRAESGTGLGLAIVKSVVEAHGGEVRITSCVDEGTRVELVLPTLGAP